MKKILLSSLIAVMAVSAANAKIASTDYADSVADAAEAAAIEAAASYATTKANTAESNAKADTVTKLDALDATVSATDGVVTGVTQENGKITGVTSAKVTSAMIADDAAIKKTQLADTVQQSLTKADNAATAIGSETIAKGDTSAIVNATTLTGAINELSSAVKKVSGGELTLGSNAVSTGNIQNGAVTEAKLDTTLADKINNKADSTNVYTKTEIDTVLGENGTTGQAIAAAAQAAAQAATAAATAQSTADGAVSVNAEQATAITNLQNADTTITNKFGNLGDKTVAQAIADAQTAATYSDTEVRGLISANTTAIGEINNGTVMKSGITAEDVAQIETNKTDIATLKGTGEGSVSKAVTDGIAGITATVTGDAGVIKTLSQTAGKVSATRELVATADLDTTVNNALTNANNAAAFMSSVQGASTNQTDATKAYVLTASKDNQGNMTYTWEEIDRTVLSNN